MNCEGSTPIEVRVILRLRNYDLAIRCLEVVRLNLPFIFPSRTNLSSKVLALCHHSSTNCYPAIGVFGLTDEDDLDDIEQTINSWAEAKTVEWLISSSESVTAQSWADLNAISKQ